MVEDKNDLLRRQMLKHRKYNEWIKLIGRIVDSRVRAHVACHVFWDFQSYRIYSERKNQLRKWMAEYDIYGPAKPEELEKALLSIGYDNKLVRTHIKIMNKYYSGRNKKGPRHNNRGPCISP